MPPFSLPGQTTIDPVGAALGATPQPPMPVSQPGAEAPVAPPESSAQNLLTSLGLSAPNMAALDSAVSRSTQRNAAAQSSLQGIADRRDEVINRMGEVPRPVAPNLREIPEAPPLPEPTDTLRVFGQVLPVLAMLGGALIRNNSTAALQAGAAAMQAARDNDAEALERANEQWERSLQATVADNERAIQTYNAALSMRETDMDGMLAELNALAAQEQNPLLQAQIAQGDIAAISAAMSMRLQANQQLISAMEVVTRANGSGANRPLRGPDGAQMTRVRETAESSRGLRGLTQEFAQSMTRARERGVMLGPGSGVQVWDPDVQNMSAVGARMLGLMRPTGSGATSDFEQRIYARGAPGIDRTTEANQAIMQGIERLTQIADARQFYYEEYAQQMGHLNGAERAFQSSPEFQALAIDPGGDGDTQTTIGGGNAPDDPLGIRRGAANR